MIAFEHIEGSTVGSDATKCGSYIDIRIGIAVAVGVCGEIVGNEIGSDRDVLSDRFPMVPGYARDEILWSFDTPCRCLNRQTRKRDRCTGAPWVCIQNLLADHDPLR